MKKFFVVALLLVASCGPRVSDTDVNEQLRAELVQRLASADTLATRLAVDVNRSFLSWISGVSDDMVEATITGPLAGMGFVVVNGRFAPRDYDLDVEVRYDRRENQVQVSMALGRWRDGSYGRGYSERVTAFVVTNSVHFSLRRSVEDALLTGIERMQSLLRSSTATATKTILRSY